MRLPHGRIGLELHRIRPERHQGEGPPLLLLHELYGSSVGWNGAADAWPGPVHGLDFCGHGDSDWLVGGAYCSELLLGDADVALAQIGSATVMGKGVGAYVALLLAGARSAVVSAAVLAPGCGDDGGGAWPDFLAPAFHQHLAPPSREVAGVDPNVRAIELEARPIDYVEPFAKAAQRLWFVEDGTPRAPWWDAARKAAQTPRVAADLTEALQQLGETD